MSGERLIMVRSCVQCPLGRVRALDDDVLCTKTDRSVKPPFRETPIPDWCPLIHAHGKGFGPVPTENKNNK